MICGMYSGWEAHSCHILKKTTILSGHAKTIGAMFTAGPARWKMLDSGCYLNQNDHTTSGSTLRAASGATVTRDVGFKR